MRRGEACMGVQEKELEVLCIGGNRGRDIGWYFRY